jgi:hypothetical protein
MTRNNSPTEIFLWVACGVQSTLCYFAPPPLFMSLSVSAVLCLLGQESLLFFVFAILLMVGAVSCSGSFSNRRLFFLAVFLSRVAGIEDTADIYG